MVCPLERLLTDAFSRSDDVSEWQIKHDEIIQLGDLSVLINRLNFDRDGSWKTLGFLAGQFLESLGSLLSCLIQLDFKCAALAVHAENARTRLGKIRRQVLGVDRDDAGVLFKTQSVQVRKQSEFKGRFATGDLVLKRRVAAAKDKQAAVAGQD